VTLIETETQMQQGQQGNKDEIVKLIRITNQ
jgi:hypothetical protein